jgi:4-aminobutyrate aminotransferase-like enzyme
VRVFMCSDKMLLLSAGAFEAIRVIPPLTASPEELDIGMGILTRAIIKSLAK